jgi:hypothetical protein
MMNKLVGTQHTSLRRGIQLGQVPLRDGMQFGIFFFACNSDAATIIISYFHEVVE